MVILKIMFTNNLREEDTPVVFYTEHWSKILVAVCTMKMEYCRNKNIKLINPKQLADNLFNLFIYFYICIYLHYYCGGFILVMLLMLYDDYMLLIILIVLCKYYDSYDYRINILHFLPLCI